MVVALVVGVASSAPMPVSAQSPTTVSAGWGGVLEGDTGSFRRLRIPVALSEPSPVEVTVDVELDLNGTTSSPRADAVDVVDWRGRRKTVTFRPNPRTGLTPTVKYVTVKVRPDEETGEFTETFMLRLSNTVNAVLGNGSTVGANPVGRGFITDDDDVPVWGQVNRVHASGVSVPEGNGSPRKSRFAVTLRDPATRPVAVRVTAFVDEGTPGVDFKSLSNTGSRLVTFLPGQVQRFVSVETYGNTTPNDRVHLLMLLSSADLPIGTIGSVSTLDDDAATP
jgi:hypothetical protein